MRTDTSARDAVELAALPTPGERVAATAACPCGTNHRAGTKVAAEHAALYGPKLPDLSPEDLLGALSLLDGRLVVMRSGGVLAVSPSRFQDPPLPGQIADRQLILEALHVASGGQGRQLCERMNRHVRAQLPLATAIPETWLADAVDVLLEDVAARAELQAA